MSDQYQHNNIKPSQVEGFWVAVAAETLFLANLLILPVIAFVFLVILWLATRKNATPLALAHMQQTLSASIWAGMLLIVSNALILLLGGYQGMWVWVIVILYFTLVHSVMLMFGAFGLSKAMAAQTWRFPFFGRPLPDQPNPPDV